MGALEPSRLCSAVVQDLAFLDQLAAELGAEPDPVTGPVPQRWQSFLHARHLNAYYARILACVRNPVEVENCGDRRRIGVLGTAVFEFDRNGFLKVFLWLWSDGHFGCQRAEPAQISVGETPHGWTWLELFRHGFAFELARRLGCDTGELVDYSRWAFDRFRRLLARDCDLRHLRECIAQALALDPLALQIARRIRLDCRYPKFTTVREYNHALAHLAAYRKLSREAPNLVPLYAAQAELVLDQGAGEPAQLLRQVMVNHHGVMPATWALAHNMRPRWLYFINDFYDPELPASEATADLLRVIEMLGCTRLPPRWYLWEVLQLFGNPESRQPSYADRWGNYAVPLRRITALIERADRESRQLIRRDLYEVLAWLVDSTDRENGKGLPRAGWKWFARRAAAWRAAQEAAARNAAAWPVPFARHDTAEGSAVTLSAAPDLVREAHTMRHCIDSYVERCHSGRSLVLSIVRAGRDRPIATALLRVGRSGWQVIRVAGVANSRPRAVARWIARSAADRINAMRWRPKAPLAQPTVDVPPNPVLVEDLLVGMALDRIVPTGEDRARIDAWFLDNYDDRTVHEYGTLVPRSLGDQWNEDWLAFLESANADGAIDADRAAKLEAGHAPTRKEREALRACWIAAVLEQNLDHDLFPTWFIWRLEDRAGRVAFLLGSVRGYSFTIVKRRWHLVAASVKSIKAALRRSGWIERPDSADASDRSPEPINAAEADR